MVSLHGLCMASQPAWSACMVSHQFAKQRAPDRKKEIIKRKKTHIFASKKKKKKNDPRGNRTPNLRVWNPTRCHCAMESLFIISNSIWYHRV
jgi:hypothetical protein